MFVHHPEDPVFILILISETILRKKVMMLLFLIWLTLPDLQSLSQISEAAPTAGKSWIEGMQEWGERDIFDKRLYTFLLLHARP